MNRGHSNSRRWLLLSLALVVIAASALMVTRCERIEQTIYEAGLAAERQLAGLDEGWLDTGEEVLAFLEREGVGPRLVLIHGFASQKDIWLQMVQGLPDELPVLAPDLPGHGGSSRELERDYSVASLASAVIRLIEQHGDGRPAHLAGSSLGGAVALLVAATRPELVHSLVLFNPAGAPGVLSPDLEREPDDPDHPLIVNDREDFDRMVRRVFADPPIMPWPAPQVLTRMHAGRVELHRKIWTDVRDSPRPPEDLLTAIESPVLLVWGMQDQVLDASAIDFFAEHIEHIRVERLDDAGHTPIIEKAGLTARLLADFIASTENAATGR